MIKLFIL